MEFENSLLETTEFEISDFENLELENSEFGMSELKNFGCAVFIVDKSISLLTTFFGFQFWIS